MKITIDNYTQFFSDINSKFSKLQNSGNKNADETVKRIQEEIDTIYKGGNTLKETNNVLKIGIVGQVKAGKSSFLNSLFFNGENVLPKASTPMTAGLTILQYGEQNEFEVEYYNSYEWKAFEDKAKTFDDIIESYKTDNPSLTKEDIVKMAEIDSQIIAAKELVEKCNNKIRINIQEKSKKEVKSFSDTADLQSTLEKYVGANGDYTPIVKCLTIKLHDKRLKEIQIVDTPGVNDPVLSREQRTRDFLQECHGVFFLSYSGRFFDSTDVSFLTERIGSQGIGEVVLIGSKFDSVLQDVGIKYNDDLGGAIEYCQRSLKKQYERNISASDFSGKDPRLDFSSGIGFSISQKDKSRWDEMESHVVKQMETFYPSFFSTEQEIKNTFFNLSQIEDIRDKYVEQLFKSKKDEIIQEKINSYFNNTSKNLIGIIEKEQNKLSNCIDLLRNSNINEIEKKRNNLNTIVNHVEKDLISITNRTYDKTEKQEKNCLNIFNFHWNGQVPTIKVSGNFYRTSTFLKQEKSFQCEYEKVDLHSLISNLCKSLDTSLEQLSRNWEKGMDETRNFILENISEKINEYESKDTSNSLDASLLYNIMNETLDRMSNKSVLEINTIKQNFKDSLTNMLTGKNELNIDKECTDERMAMYYVSEKARQLKDEKIPAIVHSCINALMQEIKDMLRKSTESNKEVLKNKKNEFIQNVKDSLKYKLDNLTSELNDKKKNLHIMEGVMKELDMIKGKI